MASSNKCLEFNFVSLFTFSFKIFLSYEVLYKQNFLEYAFQIKILKLSIGSFIEIIETYVQLVLITINFEFIQVFMKSLHNFMVIMKYGTIMLNDSLFMSSSQFVTIPWKAQLSFCKIKQSDILHSYFYQRRTPNTKKLHISSWVFNLNYVFIIYKYPSRDISKILGETTGSFLVLLKLSDVFRHYFLHLVNFYYI